LIGLDGSLDSVQFVDDDFLLVDKNVENTSTTVSATAGITIINGRLTISGSDQRNENYHQLVAWIGSHDEAV